MVMPDNKIAQACMRIKDFLHVCNTIHRNGQVMYSKLFVFFPTHVISNSIMMVSYMYMCMRWTGASSRNVGKISFFAIKLSTREQSATFHEQYNDCYYQYVLNLP